MKYFCTETERSGTYYLEFHRGTWDKIHYWNPHSLLLSGETLEKTGLNKAFVICIPDYDDYTNTVVSPKDWAAVLAYVKEHLRQDAQEAVQELDGWIQEVFAEHGVVTILGI